MYKEINKDYYRIGYNCYGGYGYHFGRIDRNNIKLDIFKVDTFDSKIKKLLNSEETFLAVNLKNYRVEEVAQNIEILLNKFNSYNIEKIKKTITFRSEDYQEAERFQDMLGLKFNNTKNNYNYYVAHTNNTKLYFKVACVKSYVKEINRIKKFFNDLKLGYSCLKVFDGTVEEFEENRYKITL